MTEPRQSPELWMPVPGFDGYEVSDVGRVRSLDRTVPRKNGFRQRCMGRVLKQGKSGQHGYPAVGLHREGVSTCYPVHRIVLLAFVGPLPAGMHTRHINGDHTDNRLINLAYGTPTENTADKFRHGTFRTRASVATQCGRGHDFTPENVKRDRLGQRHCKTCRRDRDREQKRRSRAQGLIPGDQRHGTVSGYRNFACRCTPCREANTSYDQSRKQRAAA